MRLCTPGMGMNLWGGSPLSEDLTAYGRITVLFDEIEGRAWLNSNGVSRGVLAVNGGRGP